MLISWPGMALGDFAANWYTGQLFSGYGMPLAEALSISPTTIPAVDIFMKVFTRIFQSAATSTTMAALVFPFGVFESCPRVITA